MGEIFAHSIGTDIREEAVGGMMGRNFCDSDGADTSEDTA